MIEDDAQLSGVRVKRAIADVLNPVLAAVLRRPRTQDQHHPRHCGNCGGSERRRAGVRRPRRRPSFVLLHA